MTDISVAIVGDGLASRVFHVPFIEAVPGLKIKGVVKRSGDPTSISDVETVYRSYHEAIEDPSIDLLVIATPNDSHYEIARAAIAADKHLVIDKPITETSVQALELINAAKQVGTILAPFHNRRFDGDFRTVQSLCESKSLGRIVRIHSAFDSFQPKVRTSTWRENEGVGSGLLYDLGPHLFDQAISLFGAPKSIFCRIAKEREGSRVVDAFNTIFEFDQANGHTIEYHCSANKISAMPAPRFIIHGTQGSFTKLGLDPQEDALEARVRVPRWDTGEVWGAEDKANWGELVTMSDEGLTKPLLREAIPTEAGDYRAFYANVRNAIKDGEPLQVKPEDGLLAIQLIELAIQSSNQGMALDLSNRLGTQAIKQAPLRKPPVGRAHPLEGQ